MRPAVQFVVTQCYVFVATTSMHAGLSKGSTVRRLLDSVKPDFVLCMGDDKSDEEMFHTFNESAYNDTMIFACTVRAFALSVRADFSGLRILSCFF